jgi:hypothetical protein
MRKRSKRQISTLTRHITTVAALVLSQIATTNSVTKAAEVIGLPTIIKPDGQMGFYWDVVANLHSVISILAEDKPQEIIQGNPHVKRMVKEFYKTAYQAIKAAEEMYKDQYQKTPDQLWYVRMYGQAEGQLRIIQNELQAQQARGEHPIVLPQ